MLNRRKVLGWLGMAPVAASQLVDTVVASETAIRHVPGSGVYWGDAEASTVGTPLPAYSKDIMVGQWHKQLLGDLKHNRPTLERARREVNRLDGDIASMRFPIATKIRMQAERDVAHWEQSQHDWLARRVARLLDGD